MLDLAEAACLRLFELQRAALQRAGVAA